MTQKRKAAIETAIVILEAVCDKCGTWFDAEHEEWSEDKKNPDRENDLSLDLRTDNFRLAGECLENAMDHLRGTL